MLHDDRGNRTLQQRTLEDDPQRPMSAIGFGFGEDAFGNEPADGATDIEMEDAGPSTAPLDGLPRDAPSPSHHELADDATFTAEATSRL